MAANRVDAGDDAAAGLFEHHRYHHHGGVTLLIAMSLDTLGVPPAERDAVEKIRNELHARMEPARAAEQNLVATLVDGLVAGKFDKAQTDNGVMQVNAAAAAVHDAAADALNQLHSVLTPPEREALVDKLEAHWLVWRKANADDTGPTLPEGSHLAALVVELQLSSDQADKIRAGLAEQMKAVPRLDLQKIALHLRAFADAFRSETFDAKALTTMRDANMHMAGWGSAHLADFVETVSPILTSAQRDTLAQRLHQHAVHDPSAGATP
jgi:Spy/CpxP family protein refolding chaperone